jgi:hypothetical protein
MKSFIVLLSILVNKVLLEEKYYQNYINLNELKDIYITDKEIKEDEYFRQILKENEDLIRNKKELSCTMLIKDYLSQNIKKIKGTLAEHSNKDKVFDFLYSKILDKCKDNINDKQIKYMLNSENRGKLLLKENLKLVEIDYENLLNKEKEFHVDEKLKEYLKIKEKEDNTKSRFSLTKENEKDEKSIEVYKIFILILVLFGIAYLIRSYNLKNNENNEKVNNKVKGKKNN